MAALNLFVEPCTALLSSEVLGHTLYNAIQNMPVWRFAHPGVPRKKEPQLRKFCDTWDARRCRTLSISFNLANPTEFRNARDVYKLLSGSIFSGFQRFPSSGSGLFGRLLGSCDDARVAGPISDNANAPV